LKRDIQSEIKNNYKNENFIVIITNVNLTPAKYSEFITTGNDSIKNQAISNCEFILWHEAILEAYLVHYPIISQWFWRSESILLQPYEEYFSKPLNGDSHDLRYQLSNDFYGREEYLLHLSAFIKNAQTSSLAIIANGGYGKTRLSIEFFKREISQDSEWIPLVLSHTGFNATQFVHLIDTKRRLLILIDDAHEIPQIVGEAKRLIDNTRGKNKLLLTTRPCLFLPCRPIIPVMKTHP